MSRTFSYLTVVCALVAALLATSSTSASAGPGYHQPKVGSCHDLTLRQALSWSAPTAAIDCDKRHTTKTMVVKRLSGDVDWQAPDIWRGV